MVSFYSVFLAILHPQIWGLPHQFPMSPKFSFYGFGVDVQNPSSLLDYDASAIPQIDFYGKTIVRSGDVYPITTELSLMGDIVLLSDLPGVPRDTAQIATVVLIDNNGQSHYAEIQVQYTDSLRTTDKDMCLGWKNNKVTGKTCDADVVLPITWITSYQSQGEHKNLSNDKLITLLQLANNSLHVQIYGGVGGSGAPGEFGIWQNGIFVANDLVVFADVTIP